MTETTPTIAKLLESRAASRIHAKDAALYDFSQEAVDYSSNFMGWADLSSNPPVPLADIKELADKFVKAGMESVILVGQAARLRRP